MIPDVHDLGGRPIIVGGGIAGLMSALHIAPEPIVLLSKGPLGGEGSSTLAQGGLAACLGVDDCVELHLADTLAAGDGFCDQPTAKRFIEAARGAISHLEHLGVAFDRAPDGALRLGLEAAHSRRRIVHAAGDATGLELVRAITAAVRRTPSITVLEGVEARRLIIEDGAVAGVVAAGQHGPVALMSRRIVLATGGIGGLFCDTTNPLGCFGQGLALAARAGAEFADLEFIQFHPTALDVPHRPMPLLSEAVRGEGAVLIDEQGRRFLAGTAGCELASRDIVARAVWDQLVAGHHVFLDARECLGPRFSERFPAIASVCHAMGINPAVEPIPLRPAAHYHMGGVAVDREGRSTVPGLWACGEVACTGLHGANRLASNSLTEAVVSAAWVARSVAATAPGSYRPLPPATMPPQPDPSAIRPIVSRALGIVRDGGTLQEAAAILLPLALSREASSDPAAVALMIVVAALRREESRGAHFRSDYNQREAQPRASRLKYNEAIDTAVELVEAVPSLARRV